MNLTKETKITLFYITIAFLFSVGMRMIWVYQFSGYEPFMFNNQFMINTNDGYYFAEGARDIINGISQKNDLSPIDNATSQLTAFLANVLPFSFESIILYMPVFLSSLIVVPIILIAKDLKNIEMGFIAALLASIAWSYYNRTMVGYYDTDMLNIVFPTILLWSLIWALDTKEEKYILISALDILLYRWWYPQSYALEFAFFGFILVYTLIWDRKKIFNYKLLAMMMFAMLNLDGYIRSVILVGLYILFKQERFDRYVYYILGIAVLSFLATGGFDPIWLRVKVFILRDSVQAVGTDMVLNFYGVGQTIREAGKIPFETFANRISGHTVTFLLSLLGYIWLVYKHRIMLFALPMVGLGFLAYVGGLRFTIYAVPILALGIAFLITEGLKYITDKKSVKIFAIIALSFAILIPNIKHIESYKVPTVFKADEVKVLDKLKGMSSREDYVVTWWDYGYPIRYYSDVKTLVDGGKHEGDVNFPVSFVLTNPQDVAAKMARLDVEYTEKRYKSNNGFSGSNIEQMTKDYGFDDTNDFLLSLQTDIKVPKKTRDIYLYLPYRMLDIYPTVKVFSNLDLMNGQKFKRPFFYVTRNFKKTDELLYLGNNIVFNLKNSSLQLGNKNEKIRRFTTTQYSNNRKLNVDEKLLDFSSNISIIYMKNYNTFLVVDEDTYNSTYIQMMALEKYDDKLFEKVILSPHVKVYKLKI